MSENTELALSRLHFPVTTLGPGKRIGIWFQGCSIRCKGCISVDTWPFHKPDIKIETLLETISPWIDQSDGVTISGGEPFDQPDALVALVKTLKALTSQSILVFTGYGLEKISAVLSRANGCIDALMSEPYQWRQPQTLALRGSDNQQLHLLTPLGKREFAGFDRLRTEQDNRLDIMFDESGTVWLAGIPKHQDFQRLKQLMKQQGHKIKTTGHPLIMK